MAAPKVSDADRKALIDKVKKYVKDNGGDETKAAAALNKDKVPTLRGVVGNWDKRRVVWMAAGALPPSQQGAPKPRPKPAPKTVPARKPGPRKKPVATRAAARKGTASNGGKSEARPLDKAAQASGTSRGGSGKRGVAAAAKK